MTNEIAASAPRDRPSVRRLVVDAQTALAAAVAGVSVSAEWRETVLAVTDALAYAERATVAVSVDPGLADA
jgi:hypothetical protein